MKTSLEVAPASRRSDLDLIRDYFRRNWWLVLGSVAFAIIAALVYLRSSQMVYRATAVMVIQPQSSQQEGTLAAPATPQLVRTQLEIMKSQRVLNAVVKKLRLDRDPEFTAAAPPTANPALRAAVASEEIADRLEIENDGRSYTINLTAKASHPEQAALIANTVATTYIAAQQAQKVRLVETVQAQLGRRLAILRARTVAAEQAAENYRQGVDFVPLSSVPEDSESYAASTPASREIIEMSKEHAALAARRGEAGARHTSQQRAISRGQGDSTPEVLASSVISNLRMQEGELARRESELLALYEVDHPLVRPAQAQLMQIRRQISAETRRIHRSVASQAQASSGAFDSGDRFMKQLGRERSRDLAVSTRLTQLQRDAQLQRDTYEAAVAQSQQATEQTGLQLPDVLLISPASPPVRSTRPPTSAVLLIAAVIGLLIGLLLGLVRSILYDRRARKVRERDLAPALD